MMKSYKIILPLFFALALLFACVKKYEEPTGNEFKGTFVWRYSDTIKDNKTIVRNKFGGSDLVMPMDTSFIEIKADKILNYHYSRRDTLSSYYYALNRENDADIYIIPFDDEQDKEDSNSYRYYATYSFNADTLMLQTFLVKPDKQTIDRTKLLIRRAYVRPKK